MLKTKSRPMTRHDYAQLPASGPRVQLIDGEFHMTPAPNRRHQEISGNLEFIIRCHLEKHPGGKLYDAPFDVYLGDIHVLQPDILYYSEKRLGHLTDAGAEGAPDLVVEILSKSNAPLDKGVKKELYTRYGTRELWLIDPDKEELQLFDLRENPETPKTTLYGGDRLTTPLLPGLEVSLEKVFAGRL